ncbi:hypothetical protein EVAR_7748_1 [Eumeta japonica]|uniref:Uncharacterized protein n=1 Tax=Eumeta variegata TaxID=151549 RepID=A0A4C1TJU6_EUMVA|nr:hypothetical protein EVAR_7748_1 [Eumeta japonica]
MREFCAAPYEQRPITREGDLRKDLRSRQHDVSFDSPSQGASVDATAVILRPQKQGPRGHVISPLFAVFSGRGHGKNPKVSESIHLVDTLLATSQKRGVVDRFPELAPLFTFLTTL